MWSSLSSEQRPGLWRGALLVALALGAVFPYGWLAKLFEPLSVLLYTLFPNDMMHSVGHLVLFCVVGGLLLLIVPSLLRHGWLYGVIVLVVAASQELLQVSYNRITWNDVQDMGFDLIGAGLAFVLARWIVRRHTADRGRETEDRGQNDTMTKG